jgi:poly-gamma-glutamate synthesis protein (capsule biosynthesis protein)
LPAAFLADHYIDQADPVAFFGMSFRFPITFRAGESLNQTIEPLIIEKNSIKIAIISYTDPSLVSPKYEATETSAGTAFMKLDLLKTAITKAKNQADFVIVTMHSGTEYELEPDNTQVTFAQSAIDYGADLVVGHHPHVIEPIRLYKGKFIIYSLGNYILDQMWSQETREGLIAKVIFTDKGVENIIVNTTQIENYSQPRIIYTDQNTKPLARLQMDLHDQPAVFWDESSKSYKLGDQKYMGSGKVLGAPSSIQTDDLNKDGTVETYELKNGQLTITSNSKTLWKSPATWWIDSYKLADVNNDGITDINLSIWKQGSFDKYMPVWHDKNDLSIKNHFFVLDLDTKQGTRPIWQSSNLAKPNCSFDISDLNNDGKVELITQEGEYTDNYTCATNNYGIWTWDEFGFTNVWNSNPQ